MLCTLKHNTFEAVEVPDLSSGTWPGAMPDWVITAFVDEYLAWGKGNNGYFLTVGLSGDIPGRPWGATCGAAVTGNYLVRNPDGTITIVDTETLHRHCNIS